MNRIKDYIFASVRLRQIVNASALLSDVNERQTQLLVEDGIIIEQNMSQRKVHNDTTAEIIFTAGGVTQAVFTEKEAAETCKKELEALYPSETGTATVAVHVEPWKVGEEFVDVVLRALRKVRQKKDAGESDPNLAFKPISFSSGSPFFRICAQTGKEFATKWGTTADGEKQEFGQSAWKQYEWEPQKTDEIDPGQGDRLRADSELRKRFAEVLPIDSSRFNYSADLEKLTIPSKPANYLGFMDADGNGLGDVLSILGKNNAGEKDYRAFSELLKDATREAYIKAAAKVLVPFLRNLIKHSDSKQKITLPIRLLIMGGDDIMVVSLPQFILPLANEFCREFQRIAKDKMSHSESNIVRCKLDPFTMSAGVVIAHRGFPFLSFQRLGNHLLKSAKKRSWAAKRDGQGFFGSVDYQILTASGADDLKTLRKEVYTLHYTDESEISLTGKPYLVSPELDELQTLRYAVAKMKKVGVSRRQIKALNDILRRGERRSHIDFLRWFSRLGEREEAQKQIMDLLDPQSLCPSPWRKDDRKGKFNRPPIYTPLLDAAELFDIPDDLASADVNEEVQSS